MGQIKVLRSIRIDVDKLRPLGPGSGDEFCVGRKNGVDWGGQNRILFDKLDEGQRRLEGVECKEGNETKEDNYYCEPLHRANLIQRILALGLQFSFKLVHLQSQKKPRTIVRGFFRFRQTTKLVSLKFRTLG